MEQFVDSVLAKLTLEEKLGQLAQYRGRGTPTGPQVPEGGEAEIRAGRVGSFLGVHGAAWCNVSPSSSRGRASPLFAEDVIHGFRTSSVPLARRRADVAAVGARRAWRPPKRRRPGCTGRSRYGRHRPRRTLGRIEGAGEDPPYLGPHARALGQAGPARPLTIMATAKHFAAYGAAVRRDYHDRRSSARCRLPANS
jgi:beta-glucosidase